MNTTHLNNNYYIKERINNRLIRMGLTTMPIIRTDISYTEWENKNIEFKLYENIGWALKNNTFYYCDICNNIYNYTHKILFNCNHSVCSTCETKISPKLCPFCRTPIYNDGHNHNEEYLYRPTSRNFTIPLYEDIGIYNIICLILKNNWVNIVLVLFFILTFVFIFWTLFDNYTYNLLYNHST